MIRNPEADQLVQIVSDPSIADSKVQVTTFNDPSVGLFVLADAWGGALCESGVVGAFTAKSADFGAMKADLAKSDMAEASPTVEAKPAAKPRT